MDPTALVAELDRHAITVMQATPATWRMLTDAGWEGNATLKALCGGEALPQALAESLCSRVGEAWNMYGPTETTIWSTIQRVVPGAAVSIGRAIANTTLYVLDPQFEPVPIGVAGELMIGGDGLARGYFDLDAMTADRFVPDPFAAPVAKGSAPRGSAPRGSALEDVVPEEVAQTHLPRLYRTGDLVRYRADGRANRQGDFLGNEVFQLKSL